MSHKNQDPRVVVLGFDGLDFQLVDKMIEAGAMPNFKKAKSRGSWGPLTSTIPPSSPTAWNSMITGLQPAKHGVYDFYKFDHSDLRASLITRRQGGKALWEILSEKGLSSYVINVPCTYPPDRIDGAMISGFMSSSSLTDSSYPVDFVTKIREVAPNYEIDPPEKMKGTPRDYVKKVRDATIQKRKLLNYIMEQKDWSLLFYVFAGTDRIQHKLWPEIEDEREYIREYYSLIDDIFRQVRDKMRDDDLLLVVSDHGFEGINSFAYLNESLQNKDLLKFKYSSYLSNLLVKRYALPALEKLGLYDSSSGFKLGVREKLRDRIKGPLLIRMIDFSKDSLLFVLTNAGLIYSVEGENRRGNITPASRLLNLKSEIESLPEIEEVFTREEAFGSGPFLEEAPGLVALSSHRDLRHEITALEEPPDDLTGKHSKKGLFLAQGGNVNSSYYEKANIIDIAPTVLDHLGILEDPGVNLDGKPLVNIIT